MRWWHEHILASDWKKPCWKGKELNSNFSEWNVKLFVIFLPFCHHRPRLCVLLRLNLIYFPNNRKLCFRWPEKYIVIRFISYSSPAENQYRFCLRENLLRLKSARVTSSYRFNNFFHEQKTLPFLSLFCVRINFNDLLSDLCVLHQMPFDHELWLFHRRAKINVKVNSIMLTFRIHTFNVIFEKFISINIRETN